MIDIQTLYFIIFFAAVAVVVVYDWRNIEAHGPLLIRKTIRGKRFIIRTAIRFRRFWTHLGSVGVVAGFIASLYTLYMLIVILIDSIIAVKPAVGVGLVLPSPVAIVGGGFIGVPLWYWLAAAIVMFVVHEGAHGIIGASQNMKIKKLGWMLFTLLPIGAFVEPDEKDVAAKKPMPQLRFFAAGSFSNFILAFVLALVITPLMLNPLTVPAQGLQVFPQAGFPFGDSAVLAEKTNNFSQELNTKFFMRTINGKEIQDYDSATEVLDVLAIKPGQVVNMNLDVYYGDSKENIDITLESVANPNDETRGYIGILFDDRESFVVRQEYMPFRGVIFFITEMFFWVFLINLGVGMFNMLPLGPLDGKRMWAVVLQKYMPNRHKWVMRLIEWGVLFVLLAILAPAIVSNFL
jgi:membrane-associated protease RseP (regulator of RpoE activity)